MRRNFPWVSAPSDTHGDSQGVCHIAVALPLYPCSGTWALSEIHLVGPFSNFMVPNSTVSTPPVHPFICHPHDETFQRWEKKEIDLLGPHQTSGWPMCYWGISHNWIKMVHFKQLRFNLGCHIQDIQWQKKGTYFSPSKSWGSNFARKFAFLQDTLIFRYLKLDSQLSNGF